MVAVETSEVLPQAVRAVWPGVQGIAADVAEATESGAGTKRQRE